MSDMLLGGRSRLAVRCWLRGWNSYSALAIGTSRNAISRSSAMGLGRLRLCLSALASFAALSMACLVTTASAGQIVVWEDYSTQGGIVGIWKANADGSNAQRIPLPYNDLSQFPDCSPVPDVGSCATYFPSLSPDGTRIAFQVFNGDVYTSDLDGGSLRRVIVSQKTSYPGCPVCGLEAYLKPKWSPDGHTLVVERSDATGSSIYVVNADGADLHQVVHWGGYQRGPSFTGDGNRIVFASTVDPSGNPLPRQSIFTTALDGSDPRQITSQTDVGYENPVVDAGSSEILFNQKDIRGTDIFRIGFDGSGLRDLTPTSDQEEYNPDYSSDGRQVAFGSFPPDRSGQRIEVMNRDGASSFPGCFDPVTLLRPRWESAHTSTPCPGLAPICHV